MCALLCVCLFVRVCVCVCVDSHSNMYGGLGCLGTPVVRTDAAAIWATGQTWWQMPPAARVRLQGVLREVCVCMVCVRVCVRVCGVGGVCVRVCGWVECVSCLVSCLVLCLVLCFVFLCFVFLCIAFCVFVCCFSVCGVCVVVSVYLCVCVYVGVWYVLLWVCVGMCDDVVCVGLVCS